MRLHSGVQLYSLHQHSRADRLSVGDLEKDLGESQYVGHLSFPTKPSVLETYYRP